MNTPRRGQSVPTIRLRRRWIAAILVCAFFSALWPQEGFGLQIRGLKSPQSILVDPAGQEYFISNINGEPDARDNNGFITKLDKDGKITHRHFIKGGRGKVILHAPKGMAIVKNILYVADLDTLRGFDRATGYPVANVRMPFPPGDSKGIGLTDVLHVGQGFLYLSDTETHSIFRVDTQRDHIVSVLVTDEKLAGPRGLALDPKTGHLIVTSWNEGTILEVDGEGHITEIVSNGFFTSRFKNLDGVDFDQWGNLYVSDFTAGKIWRIRPNKQFQVIAEYLPTPAGISVDRKNNLILVPYLYADAAEINGLETPGKKKMKKRTLEDYGYRFLQPKKEGQTPDE